MFLITFSSHIHSRGSEALFWLPQIPSVYLIHMKANTHMNKKNLRKYPIQTPGVGWKNRGGRKLSSSLHFKAGAQPWSPALSSRQGDQQFEASLGYMRVCLKTKKKIKTFYSEIKGVRDLWICISVVLTECLACPRPWSTSMPKINKEERTKVFSWVTNNHFPPSWFGHCWKGPRKQLMWLFVLSEPPPGIVTFDKLVSRVSWTWCSRGFFVHALLLS